MQEAPGLIVDGKYRLTEKIAEGGGGSVWKTTDASGKEIALKFLKWSPLTSKKRAADRFKSEFSILKNLSHPHIAKIYDFGRDPQTELYYFTQELLTAGNLQSVAKASVAVVEDLLLQSLRALEYLRNQGLLHLDIKPQNLLLRKDGDNPELALIDFGVAAFRPPDKPGGTPNYMPPETAARRLPQVSTPDTWPDPDHRSDLYSLGISFYALLTGELPFRRTFPESTRLDAQATMAAHLTDIPKAPSDLNPDVPQYLSHIIMKLIARHPDDRYPTAGVAAQAIQYRSPRKHRPESRATLLAYLPKEGKVIGRHHEREVINTIVKGIAEGTPHIAPAVAIMGKRGVGKSRLLTAIKPLCQQYEMAVWSINAADPQDVLSLETIIESVGSNEPRVRAILIENLDAASANLLEGVKRLVRELSLQQRIADQDACRYLFAFTLNAPSREAERWLFDVELNETLCHRLTLSNFSREEVAEYLESLLGEPADERVVESLLKASDGNPLVITEHLEHMIACGTLFSLSGRPDAKTLATLGIDFSKAPPPASLTETVREHLASLTQRAQKVAELLACFGRPVSIEEIGACGLAVDAAHEMIALVEKGLVERVMHDHGTYHFVNPLAARAIVESLARDKRASYHDSIVASLERNREPDVLERDRHLAYGTSAAHRISALERLSDASIGNNQYTLAVQYLEDLLHELLDDDWERRAASLVKLVRAYVKLRQPQSATKVLKKLERLNAPKHLKRDFELRLYEERGLLELRERQLKKAKGYFEKAMRLLKKDHSDALWRVRLQNWKAAVLLRGGEAEEARNHYRANAALAQKTLSEKERASIENNELGEATLATGDAEAAIPILEAELLHAQTSGNRERIASRHYLLGQTLRRLSLASLDEARRHYETGLAIAKEAHIVDLHVRLHNGLGSLYAQHGKNAEAAEHYRAALHLAQQTESEAVSVELMVNLGFISNTINRPGDTIEYLEAALDFSGGPKGEAGAFIRKRRPDIYITLGDAHYRQHDYERAEEYLSGALEADRTGVINPPMRYNLYGTLAEVYLAKGEPKRAEALLPELKTLLKAVPNAKAHYEQIAKQLAGNFPH